MRDKQLPTILEVMTDPCVRFRVKAMLQEGMNADPVDAYYDALLVAQLLKARMDKVLTAES